MTKKTAKITGKPTPKTAAKTATTKTSSKPATKAKAPAKAASKATAAKTEIIKTTMKPPKATVADEMAEKPEAEEAPLVARRAPKTPSAKPLAPAVVNSNPYRPSSAMHKLFEKLREGVPTEKGLEQAAVDLGMSPTIVRWRLKKMGAEGYRGVHWTLAEVGKNLKLVIDRPITMEALK